MNAAAENHKRWTCLRSLMPPILARLRELKEASRREEIAARRWDAPGADPPTPAEDPTAEYIGQEWISDAMRVARELESLGFASDAEFLHQQTEFGRPDSSTPTELEAVQNIATLLARHTPEGDWCVQEAAPKLPSQSTAKPVGKGSVHQPNDEAEAIKPTGPTSKSEQRAQWLAQAMLLVRDHPDWPDAEIARRVGKDKSTLSRSKEYQAAAAMARGVKDDRHRGHISVDPDSGLRDVEAYSDAPAERDWDD